MRSGQIVIIAGVERELVVGHEHLTVVFQKVVIDGADVAHQFTKLIVTTLINVLVLIGVLGTDYIVQREQGDLVVDLHLLGESGYRIS